MKSIKVKNYNENVLEQLKISMPQEWEKASDKFAGIEKWIEKKNFPTYKQLKELAHIFHIPFGYFFLEGLPERKYPIPHYRTTTEDNINFQPSPELLETVEYIQLLQDWAKEILIDWGHEPLPFIEKYNIKSDINDIVIELKHVLELQDNWAKFINTWSEAFNSLIHKAEKAGIFVAVNGVVGNDTHRNLDVDEFRGFVLCDKIAPLIFINNQDAISAKIFTLIHEIVHLFIGESASFDLRNLQSADNEIERFCDKCSAEFLVPTSEIERVKQIDIDIENLAHQFKVSQIVIARRLLDINKISKEQFFDFYKEHIQRERKKMASNQGGDFYNTAIRRYGRKFIEIISIGVESGIIQYRDAYQLTRLKPTTFEKIKQEVLST